MPFAKERDPNHPVSGADDETRRALDVLEKDLEKLLKRKAELLERLRQIEEYHADVLAGRSRKNDR